MSNSSDGPTRPAASAARSADQDWATAPEPAGPSWINRLWTLLQLRSGGSLREDLETALQASAGTAQDFSPEERAMLKNILGLRELRVDDVMVPRPDIVAVPVDATLTELLRTFQQAEHSRLPVFGETLDEPRGIVHIKDVVRHLMGHAAPDPSTNGLDLGRVDLSARLASLELVRPVLYVPPSMPAKDLLVKMQATRLHMALVIDEYGGTDGLVTIEDLVEMVVGDIEDEHDEPEGPLLVRTADGAFVADARVSLEEAAAEIGPDLAADLAEDVDTLGGLLVTLAGRVPVRGEILIGSADLEFEVLEADPRRVKRVRVTRRAHPDGGPRPREPRRPRREPDEEGPPPESGDAGQAVPPDLQEPQKPLRLPAASSQSAPSRS